MPCHTATKGPDMTRPRGLMAALTAAAIIATGVGLAVTDVQRHRSEVRTQVGAGAQLHADTFAAELTGLSRESRTLAGASRDDGFDAATREVVDRHPGVLGAVVMDDFVFERVTLPGLSPVMTALLPVREGDHLPVDDLGVPLDVALRAVLEEGELRLVGPLGGEDLPFELTLTIDRAPRSPGRPDDRLLLLLLDLDEVLSVLDDVDTPVPLDTAIRIDGGLDGVEGIMPQVVRGDATRFDDDGAVGATAHVAGVTIEAAAVPVAGWPRTSPATPLILLPTLLGAALGSLVVERRRTERVRLRELVESATADLRRARAREKATIDHSPGGLLDVHGTTVMTVNPAGAALLGRPADEVVGASLDELVPSVAVHELDGAGREVTLDGRVLHVRSSVVATGLPDDEDRRVVTLHDVTAERRSAQVLLRYTRRLEQLNAQYDELEAVRDDFVAKVSHEIRTPLTVIAGVAQLLHRDDVAALRRDELLEALDRQLARLTDQVDGLLHLAEAARPVVGVAQDTDLAEVADDLVAHLGLECTITGTATARVAPSGAERVLRVLLTNAVKYGGDPIEVRLHTDTEQAYCEVRDHGPGLNGSRHDAFAPFVQGTSGDRRTSQGLGVGLAVARSLARAAGGDLHLVSPARPTVFRLSLPLAGTARPVEDSAAR